MPSRSYAGLAARPHLVVEVEYAVVAAQEAGHLLEVLRWYLAARDLGDLLDVRPHVLVAPGSVVVLVLSSSSSTE